MKRIAYPARALTALAVAALVLVLAPMCAAQETPSLAPANPAFESYLDGVDSVQSMGYFEPGLVPEPIDLSHLSGGVRASSTPIVSAPVSYDLRTLNKLTPVRNQGSCGSCWDFASFGSLESYLMPGTPSDFSENNLKNLAGFDIQCCSGGNRTMSTAYFARWNGPVNESDDPYNQSSCYSPQVAARMHVQDVHFIPTRSSALDNEATKQAVMTYGAVYTTYYHSDAYYNSSTGAYYYSGGGNANHAVCIVGWDDNFDRYKFRTPPPGNGAFLIRNSWGSWWGIGGYFWMSYYDSTLGKSEQAVFTAENNNYNTIYQYDTLGWIGNSGYGSSTAWFANVFTATSGSPIVAASWYAASANSTYELRVYLNPTSGPIGGSPAAVKTGTMATAGYHTVQLDSPVPVTVGQKFSVVVKINTPGYGYPIPLERPYGGYSSKATASTGQSYMSSSGTTWSDVAAQYANANVCLKAFAGGASTPTPGALSVSPAGGLNATGSVGGPFNPSSLAYTLTNTGSSSINWSASKTASWTSLSSTSGSLAPGASTTVTVSINSGANSLAAGSYSDTVSFLNSTNGSGSTGRSVSLTISGSGSLSVSPAGGFTSSGNVRGPFNPSSQVYTLTNNGSSTINWTASRTQYWTSLSATSGSLTAGASTAVTVSINWYAYYLSAGSHSDTVTFTNLTNGSGNTTRSVSLTVGGSTPTPGALTVSPATGLAASGNVGGPFSPVSASYTLTNSGGSSINWSASKTAAWTSLSATSGTLAAGASTTVTVSVNSGANGLAAGSYSDTVTFANTTNGSGNTSRAVSLTVNGAAPPPPPPSGAYRAEPATFSWIDPTAHTLVPLQNDNFSYAQTIPFNFPYYGKTYNRVYIGSNGLLGFSPTGLYNYYNSSLPASYYPNAAICPYWDNLDPAASGASVRVGVTGSAPNRKYVVTWVNVPSAYSYSAKFTFQAVFEETTGDITFQYANVYPYDYYYGAGRSATIGIENETGSEACLYSYNRASVSNYQAIRFTNLPATTRRR